VDEKNIIAKTYTHRCEPAVGGRGNLKRDCFLWSVMTRKRCRFIPCNDNAEDIELYNGLINYKEIFKMKKDMPRRTEDWLRQAEKDLRHAENSLQSGDYEWACFAAQQSAEKALKALYQVWGEMLRAIQC